MFVAVGGSGGGRLRAVTERTTPKARRGRQDGSIRQRPDGLWEARLSGGYDHRGKRIRQSVYGKTKTEVQAKLTGLRGAPRRTTATLSKVTLTEYVATWRAALEAAGKP